MANRILRDWTDSEKVNALSVHAERFFTRLIMKVDDYGCYTTNLKIIKSSLFPLLIDEVREADISRWMAECQKAGLILFYKVADKQYLRIEDFRQRLRVKTNKYPLPTDGGHMAVICQLETKRNEEKGSEVAPEVFVTRATVPAKNVVPSPYQTPELFTSKAEAFDYLKENYQVIEDARKTIRGRGWAAVDDVDVVGLIKAFVDGKAKIDEHPPSEIRQHFRNWIFSAQMEKLTDLAKNFKKSLQ